MKRLSALVCVLVLFSGCANDSGSTAENNEVAQGNDETSDDGARAQKSPSQQGKKRSGRADVSKDQSDGEGRSNPGPGSGRTGRAISEGSGEDDGSSAFYPAAGAYTYDQQGTEQFCDASKCQEEDLPATQVVRTTHESRSDDEAVVVTNARSSESRSVRTRTTHSRDGALITNVRIHFEYQGFVFNNSYQPSPPVEAVRLPLQQGQGWQGRWQDSTSGDYRVDVGAPTSVTVGGGTVRAFPLHTVTDFRGEFEGRADVTVWIDPATSAIVKTQGEIRVKSVFGSYFTRFSSSLRSAPGYP